MTRFRYGADAWCVTGCLAYALNRWWLKPLTASPFLRGHFNDLWLIPCALPWMLWLQRRLGLRHHDRPPTWPEILSHLVLWSCIAEWIGPHLLPTRGDPLDVAAYTVGALAAGWAWNRPATGTRRA